MQQEAPEVLKSKGINLETVKALSSFKDEPDWLTEKRLDAWRSFESLPMPTLRDEAWRYTDISDVTIEEFLPYSPSPDAASEDDLPDAVQPGRRGACEQGRSVHGPAHGARGARGPRQGEAVRARACRLRQVRGAERGAVRRWLFPVRAARGRCGVADTELSLARRGRFDHAAHPGRGRGGSERYLHRRVRQRGRRGPCFQQRSGRALRR